MGNRNYYLFFLILLVVGACSKISKKHLNAEQYMNWVENPKNGLVKVKSMNDEIEFTMQFRPIEHLILINHKKDELTSKLLVQEKQDIGEALQYAKFRISMKNSNERVLSYDLVDESQYTNRIAYMSFDMQNDFSLIEGQDTLSCEMFHFVRNYDLAPYIDFSLGFKASKLDDFEDKTFIYDDKIFGLGKLKFHIDKSDLEMIPELLIQ